MRTKATIAWLALLLIGSLGATMVRGQGIEREDAIQVRFLTSGQSITVDGELDEAAWGDAEVLELQYGENAGLPGSGWFIQNIGTGIEEPGNPPAGTVRMLAEGDNLYIAIEVQDESVGGSRGLWNFDGIFMSTGDWTEFGPTELGFRHFPATDEFMYVWWNAVDTTATGEPLPGIAPRKHSHDNRYGVGANFSVADSSYTEEQEANWEAVTTVNGTVSDDSGAPDQGYVMEMRLNLVDLGFDIDGPGGDVVPMGMAIQDADWYWGGPADQVATSRVWFQSQWGNFVSGVARLVFDPAVTTATAELPLLEPDIRVPNAANFEPPTIDGQLDEAVWAASTPGLQIQYQNEDLIRNWPGVTPFFSGYFNPAPEADAPAVVDPNLNSIHWFFIGETLYLGVDVDDNAVDTTRSEGGDGIRFTINDRGAFNNDNRLEVREFIISIGPNETALLDGFFAGLDTLAAGSYEVGVSLKDNSTAGDPTDVDTGYQIEIAIDLVAALGYPAGLGDRALFISANAFDHDVFEDETLNYSTRTWWSRERGAGVPAWGYLDPNAMVGVATDDVAGELPSRIRLDGNYPNPFNPATTLRYALPDAGEVTIQVFDVLGREVASMALGQQAAGTQQARFAAGGLASGLYLYRVDLRSATGAVRHSEVARMLLIK